MSLLARLFRSRATTDTYEYKVTDAPATLVRRDGASAKRITPDTVTVKFVNGKFRRMTVAGQCVEVPEIRIIRRYQRMRDVPAWATRYLAQIDQQ